MLLAPAGKFFLVREMMLQADMMRVFEAARAAAPAVVFIDDADIILGGWKPMHGASDIFRFLLSSMDGLTSRGAEGHGQVNTHALPSASPAPSPDLPLPSTAAPRSVASQVLKVLTPA